ncbi:MAG: LysR substrate-binding domain-containing protein [Candidatus Sphingomonas colombiensis]|nr:LysR substrate-binding domain-containing protein [Sphingomonas sp.]WEK42006.1 MAG: LysR substrate-binding domain-containing protein [Sphingomonas sp.]
MKDDRRQTLPPMTMLHSFAAAVRYGNFTRAGAEIGLTQSAVSRQIAGLEHWLGRALFDRIGRRIRLNEAGHAYAQAILPALDMIRRATGAVLEEGSDIRVIELAALPSFATRWLAPRLALLQQAAPGVILNVTSRSDEFDFATEHFDAAIHYGLPNWPDVEHRFLFRERCVPVLAPAMLERHGVRAPADILKLPLLAHSWRSDAWSLWTKACGLPPPPRKIPIFSNFMTLAEAVIAGAGAALIPSFMIEPEIESGRLISPFDIALEDEKAYYCVFPPDRKRNPTFARFLEWLEHQAGPSATASPIA